MNKITSLFTSKEQFHTRYFVYLYDKLPNEVSMNATDIDIKKFDSELVRLLGDSIKERNFEVKVTGQRVELVERVSHFGLILLVGSEMGVDLEFDNLHKSIFLFNDIANFFTNLASDFSFDNSEEHIMEINVILMVPKG